MNQKCSNYSRNSRDCTCSYEPCSRKGICCECVAYHRKNSQIPGCFFSPEEEETFDRSLSAFFDDLKNRGYK
jgi:hypothetical protein